MRAVGQPCEPRLVVRRPAPTGSKRDGWRMLALQASEWVQLWASRGVDFADLVLKDWEGVRGLTADEALIGREAVVLREDGRRDFDAS